MKRPALQPQRLVGGPILSANTILHSLNSCVRMGRNYAGVKRTPGRIGVRDEIRPSRCLGLWRPRFSEPRGKETRL
jgi:hypothetical protein